MALNEQNFTATCKSTTGINYTFIVRVTENSVDAVNNSSNVTVQAILQSAYTRTSFLTQTVEITLKLNDEVLVKRDAMRTCSGTAEHVFEEWTGDVVHGEDGSKSISIEGKLVSWSTFRAMPKDMTVSGEMRLTDIVLNIPPEVPQALTAATDIVAVNGGDILLEWQSPTDPDGNLSGFELERSYDGGVTYTPLGSVECAPFTDSTNGEVEPGGTILYRVRAVDEKGACSGWSEAVTVRVNTPPRLRRNLNPALFIDEAGTLPATEVTSGRPLFLFPGRWYDPDGNLDGGCLAVHKRTCANDGAESDWAKVQVFEITRDFIKLQPEVSDFIDRIQYRIACADGLGDYSAWTELLPWVKLHTAHAYCDGRWMNPSMKFPVMPYIRSNCQWVRYGGFVPEPASARLGTGRLGQMILGG